MLHDARDETANLIVGALVGNVFVANLHRTCRHGDFRQNQIINIVGSRVSGRLRVGGSRALDNLQLDKPV